jgi:hypothetical protein
MEGLTPEVRDALIAILIEALKQLLHVITELIAEALGIRTIPVPVKLDPAG